MKCIGVLHFSNIDFCIWPPGGIYMHNELQTCGKSWNLPGYNISVILISVFGHQGAVTWVKIGKIISPASKKTSSRRLKLVPCRSQWRRHKTSWGRTFAHPNYVVKTRPNYVVKTSYKNVFVTIFRRLRDVFLLLGYDPTKFIFYFTSSKFHQTVTGKSELPFQDGHPEMASLPQT